MRRAPAMATATGSAPCVDASRAAGRGRTRRWRCASAFACPWAVGPSGGAQLPFVLAAPRRERAAGEPLCEPSLSRDRALARAPGHSVRLLFLLPFPPRPDGSHGASRMTGQLLECLVSQHEVAAIYLRAREEPPIAAELANRLALAVEVDRPSLLGAGRSRRAAGRALGSSPAGRRGRPIGVCRALPPGCVR